MLKTSGGTESKTRPGEDGVRVGNSRAERGGSKLDDGRRVDGNEVGDDKVGTWESVFDQKIDLWSQNVGIGW